MSQERPLVFQVKSLNNQIKRLLERTAIENNGANLTGMQYAILGYLSEHVGVRDLFQRDVEAEFNIRRSTATGMLQLLEREGYIRRIGVPNDARLKKIVLTEKAGEVDKVASANMIRLQARLTRGITSGEMAQFYRTLDKILDNARA